MASIYTGLAFMHGHIVDRELVLRLGRDDVPARPGAGAVAREATSVGNDRASAMSLPTLEPCTGC
jgi:hypothetical protein